MRLFAGRFIGGAERFRVTFGRAFPGPLVDTRGLEDGRFRFGARAMRFAVLVLRVDRVMLSSCLVQCSAATQCLLMNSRLQ